jgi:hypothetical protein
MNLATIALVPIARPILAEVIAITVILAIPTPAIDAAPSFPTQTMSITGPSILKELLTIIGQDKETRFLKIFP